MDKVQKTVSSQCYIPSSDPFRIYQTHLACSGLAVALRAERCCLCLLIWNLWFISRCRQYWLYRVSNEGMMTRKGFEGSWEEVVVA